jgi:hypothetical protein
MALKSADHPCASGACGCTSGNCAETGSGANRGSLTSGAVKSTLSPTVGVSTLPSAVGSVDSQSRPPEQSLVLPAAPPPEPTPVSVLGDLWDSFNAQRRSGVRMLSSRAWPPPWWASPVMQETPPAEEGALKAVECGDLCGTGIGYSEFYYEASKDTKAPPKKPPKEATDDQVQKAYEEAKRREKEKEKEGKGETKGEEKKDEKKKEETKDDKEKGGSGGGGKGEKKDDKPTGLPAPKDKHEDRWFEYAKNDAMVEAGAEAIGAVVYSGTCPTICPCLPSKIEFTMEASAGTGKAAGLTKVSVTAVATFTCLTL